MTRLLLVILATVAATYADTPKEYDPLKIGPNAHPRHTLHKYLNSLTNYIYGTDHIVEDDPRAEFFNQEHQLRVYKTLNYYIEENYGTTLREILSKPGKWRYPETGMKKLWITNLIIDLGDRVAEMYFKVISSSGEKAVDQERLQQVKAKNREAANLYATYADDYELYKAYERMQSIHEPVLKNFTENIWGEEETKIKVKREAHIDVDKLQEQITVYLQKLNVYALGASQAEYISMKLSHSFDIFNEPLASQIAFKRFLQAHYRNILEQDLPSDTDKDAKEEETEEIMQIEEKTTSLWFEVVNYANLDLLKNQTVINDINAAIAAELEEYKYFRSLDEIKETNRKIHEVYGHLFKHCDQSTYLNLLKIFKELHLAERYPNPSGGFNVSDFSAVLEAIRDAEIIWQPMHGMSMNERKRVETLVHSLTVEGVRVLLKKLSEYFKLIEIVGGPIKPPRILLNKTENSQRHFNETGEAKINFNKTEYLMNLVEEPTTETPNPARQ